MDRQLWVVRWQFERYDECPSRYPSTILVHGTLEHARTVAKAMSDADAGSGRDYCFIVELDDE